MIRGFKTSFKDSVALVVMAADDVDTLNSWFESLTDNVLSGVNIFTPTFIDFLQVDVIKGLKSPCKVFTFEDEAARDSWTKSLAIEIVNQADAVDYQIDMFTNQEIKDNPNFQDRQWQHEHGSKTIAEIHGLTDDNDRWDRRTEGEKEQERLLREKMHQAQQAGKVTGDSFDPNATKSEDDGLRVIGGRQVGGHLSVIAVKKKVKPTKIELSEEKIAELEDLKSKVDREVYEEAYNLAKLEAGLEAVNADEKDKETLLNRIREGETTYEDVFRSIENGTLEITKVETKNEEKEKENLKKSVVGEEANDLATAAEKLVEDMRKAGFTDDEAAEVISQVDPSTCASQEDYFAQVEAMVYEAIKQRQKTNPVLDNPFDHF